MRATFASLGAALALAGCGEAPCDLCGKWRSDEARTLVEMASASHLSDDQRAFFSNSFFGRLVVEIRPGQTRAYFPDEDPSEVSWEQWELISRSGHNVVTRYRADNEWHERTFELHGDCYRTHVEQVGFAEWFCKE